MTIQEYIDMYSHRRTVMRQYANGRNMPHDIRKRHEWESKLLYPVDKEISDGSLVIDYGCGEGASLFNHLQVRYAGCDYIGVDFASVICNVGDGIKTLDIEACVLSDVLVDNSVMIAGSVFSHLSWSRIKPILLSLLHRFDDGVSIVFTDFISDTEGNHIEHFYDNDIDTYRVSCKPIELYSTFCHSNGLMLTQYYDYVIDHNIEYDGVVYDKQQFFKIHKYNSYETSR